MPPTPQRNALEILRQDHRKLKDLFEAFDESEDLTEQKEAAETVIRELRWHAKLRAQIFYPAVKEATRLEALIDQAEEADQDVDAVIKDLQDMEPEEPLFSDKFIELEDKVLHHMQEEENELFPQVEASDLDLNQLGEAMQDLRQKFRHEEGVDVRKVKA